jgi:hypothetical protein
MKRQFLFATGILMAGSMLLVTSCSKNDDGDSTAPVVTLNGTDEVIILNGGAWTDPGATATDDEDGTVTVISDASTTNPNPNRANSYTITYTATDAAGNVGTATRSVRVKNEAEAYAGTYSVLDTCNGTEFFAYAQTITIDSTVNNRVKFNKFANYANNDGIYAVMLGDGSLQIPLQSAVGIGSGVDPCDIVDHNFSSSPSTLIVNGFKINYSDAVTSAGCTGSTSCVAWYSK